MRSKDYLGKIGSGSPVSIRYEWTVYAPDFRISKKYQRYVRTLSGAYHLARKWGVGSEVWLQRVAYYSDGGSWSEYDMLFWYDGRKLRRV